MLDRVFALSTRGTTVRRELWGGATTFATMAYNIGNGLTAGLLVYPIVRVAAGRGREVEPGAIVLALVCLSYYAFGLPH